MKNVTFFLLLCSTFIHNSLYAQFGPNQRLAPHVDEPRLVSVADLDNDGHDDIVTNAFGGTEIGWFRNLEGSGEFSEFKPIKRQADVGAQHYVYDWDQDGDLDIFTTSSALELVYYYENLSGTGDFSTGVVAFDVDEWGFRDPTQLQVADVDQDGQNDLLLKCYGEFIWLQATGPAFEQMNPHIIADERTRIFTTGDIDGDGDVDVVYQNDEFSSDILFAQRFDTTTGDFATREVLPVENTSWIRGLGLADFNNDGNPDLYLHDNLNHIIIYQNDNGQGSFQDFELIYEGFGDLRDYLDVIDMDADGDLDLLYLLNGSDIMWFENTDGNGNFSSEIIIWEEGFTESLNGYQTIAGHLNNDNYPEIITTTVKTFAQNEVLWMEGTASQTNLDFQTLYFQNRMLSDWGIADMDNDGNFDLVSCSDDHDQLYVYLENGVDNPYHYPLSFPSSFTKFNLVDLDQDGDIDVLGNNVEDNLISWWENEDLNFTPHLISDAFYHDPGLENEPVKSVDIDGDGDLDVFVFQASSDYTVGWYENLGNGEIATSLTVIYEDTEGSIDDALPIDIDGDSDLDYVLTANNPSRLIFLIRSNVDESFAVFTRDTQSDQIYFPQFIKGSDIDGDLDLDLIFSTANEEYFWLENNGEDYSFPEVHLITDNFYTQYLREIFVEDLNGDGNEDLMFSTTGATHVYTNDGSGNFTQFFSDEVGGYKKGFPFDIDRDGDLDLLLGGREDFSMHENYANHPRIEGTVFWDENENGQFDSLEVGLPQHQVTLEPRGLVSYSYAAGAYEFVVEADTYELACTPANPWVLITDSVINITVPAEVPETIRADFGIWPAFDTITAEVLMTSAPTRCGFEVPFWINYQAESYQRSEGLITLHLDELVAFVSASPPPDFQNDSTLFWNYSELIPADIQNIELILQVAGVEQIGSSLDMMTTMSITTLDTITTIDTFFYHSIISCAYDPNDKLVLPAIEGHPNYTLLEDELSYTVRFQNTGIDTAFNVFIEDQLDENLDWNSFRLQGASHPVRVTRSETGLLTFYFDDIQLPYTSIDEPGSHGFVSYAIKSIEGIALNEHVLNSASIFFDFNPPILTNRVDNIFVEEYPVQFAITLPTCNGDEDGLIRPDFQSSDFIYTWNGVVDGPDLDSIGSGAYEFSLRRADGTLVNTSTLTVPEPPLLELEVAVNPEVDYAMNGSASIEITGGLPPYEVNWSTDPVMSGSTVANLSAGTYEVTVTDANGCESTGEAIIDLLVETDNPLAAHPGFKIFPNPVNDQLVLQSVLPRSVVVTIYNMNGQALLTQEVNGLADYRIDVSKLPTAVYLIEVIENKKNVFNHRFTVVH